MRSSVRAIRGGASRTGIRVVTTCSTGERLEPARWEKVDGAHRAGCAVRGSVRWAAASAREYVPNAVWIGLDSGIRGSDAPARRAARRSIWPHSVNSHRVGHSPKRLWKANDRVDDLAWLVGGVGPAVAVGVRDAVPMLAVDEAPCRTTGPEPVAVRDDQSRRDGGVAPGWLIGGSARPPTNPPGRADGRSDAVRRGIGGT